MLCKTKLKASLTRPLFYLVATLPRGNYEVWSWTACGGDGNPLARLFLDMWLGESLSPSPCRFLNPAPCNFACAVRPRVARCRIFSCIASGVVRVP